MAQQTIPAKRAPAKAAPRAATKATKAAVPAARKAPARKAAPRAAPAPPPAAPPPPPPGWYPMANDPSHKRYWDGQEWLGAPLPADAMDPVPAPAAPLPAQAQAAPGEPGTIELRGRTMTVAPITPEMLAVWQRIAHRFADADLDEKPGETAEQAKARNARAQRMLDRTMAVIMSVLPAEPDQDWVEDQLLAGRMQLLEATDVISLAVAVYTGGATTPAPTTGPRVSARRRPNRR